MELILLVAQLMAAASLMWACFCRLVKTDGNTCREVRWSILLLLIASGVVFGAPWLPDLMPHDFTWEPLTTPQWCWMLLLGATALVHMVTARAWLDGTPCGLDARPPRRAGASNAILPALGLGLFLLLTIPPLPARADAPEAGENVKAMLPGAVVQCNHPTGCIVMTSEVAAAMAVAAQTGVETTPCKRQSWL